MGIFTSQGYKVVKKPIYGNEEFKVKEIASREFLGSYEYIKEANDQVMFGWGNRFAMKDLAGNDAELADEFEGVYNREKIWQVSEAVSQFTLRKNTTNIITTKATQL